VTHKAVNNRVSDKAFFHANNTLPATLLWASLQAKLVASQPLRRLPETFAPDDAGLTVAFKEGRRVHSRLCGRCDTEGGRQDKSAGMKVNRYRLAYPYCRVTCAPGVWSAAPLPSSKS